MTNKKSDRHRKWQIQLGCDLDVKIFLRCCELDVFKIEYKNIPTNNYVVNVDGEEGQIYKLNNSHPAIISNEIFDVVQEEKLKRSNVVVDENGTHRSSKKYSSKKA